MNIELFIAIAGAAIATYLTRFPLMLISGKKSIPKWLEKYMNYIAPAVLTALIVPAIFVKEGKFDFSLSNEYIIAAVITALVAYLSKKMLAAVITGVCTVALLMWIM